MQNAAQTVFIVDDAPEVRKSLARVISAAGYHARAFESAEGFLAEHHGDVQGCLLLDICLPGLNGIELQHALVGSPNVLPIIFLTGLGDVKTSVGAMKKGAVDFLVKPIDSTRLFAAIEQALERDADERRRAAIRRVICQRVDTLTPREGELMAQVIRGLLNKQVAAEMGIGEKTVKVHRARMMSKMGARSVAELVQLGARVGVELEPVLDTRAPLYSCNRPRSSNAVVGRQANYAIQWRDLQ